MRQPQGSARYGSAYVAPWFRHRTTKKESRRWPRPTAAALEERIDEIMDRVARAGDDHVERAAGWRSI